MILRIARSRARKGREREFEDFVEEHAFKFMKKQKGLQEIFTGWTRSEGAREYVFASIWKSLDDVKRFAGSDWKKPVLLPGVDALIEMMVVEHYQCLDA